MNDEEDTEVVINTAWPPVSEAFDILEPTYWTKITAGVELNPSLNAPGRELYHLSIHV